MFEVVLCQPQIPPNTGNIIRLCANVGCRLHLIAPLGFDLDDRSLRRAGLDYQAMTSVSIYPDFDSFAEQCPDEASAAVAAAGKELFTHDVERCDVEKGS